MTSAVRKMRQKHAQQRDSNHEMMTLLNFAKSAADGKDEDFFMIGRQEMTVQVWK